MTNMPWSLSQSVPIYDWETKTLKLEILETFNQILKKDEKIKEQKRQRIKNIYRRI